MRFTGSDPTRGKRVSAMNPAVKSQLERDRATRSPSGKARQTPRALFYCFCLVVFGCAGGLRTQPVATAANPPGNVAVYLSVPSKNGSGCNPPSETFPLPEDGPEV